MYSVYSINEPGLRSFAMAALPVPRKMKVADDELQTISKLKIPKKVSNPSTSKNEVTEGRTYTTFGSRKVVGELKFSGRSAHCKKISRSRVVVQDTAEATIKAVTAARAERKAIKPDASLFFNPKGELKQQAFTAYWDGAVREHYPGAVLVGFTIKEFCVFRNLAKSVFATISPADVANFVVSQWTRLLKEFYVSSPKWRASEVPDIQSVIRHWSAIRPLLVAYYSADAVRERHSAGVKQQIELREAKATKEELESVRRRLEAEQDRIRKLEREKAEVYSLARKRGVDLRAAREEQTGRKTRTQALLDAQVNELGDEELPDWK
jgi:uncharacterized protein (UPF0335 family)